MATQINYKQIKAEADLYKYQIVPSISSWNLTVALKNYLWQDPSVTTPVKVQIWSEVRTITSALGMTINAWVNWLNAGSSELATKEIDYFTYLIYDATLSKVWLLTSRIPWGRIFWDFSTNWTNEKWMSISQNVNPSSTDTVINIWRFSAILSAGAWYTWSTPSAWFQVINHYINESKLLYYTPTWYALETQPSIWNWTLSWSYKIIWDTVTCHQTIRPWSSTTFWTGYYAFSWPFWVLWSNNDSAVIQWSWYVFNWTSYWMMAHKNYMFLPGNNIQYTTWNNNCFWATNPITFANWNYSNLTATYIF